VTAEEIAGRLGGRAAGPGRWRARCPVHRGRSATSLSIAQGERGILLRCWKGCGFEQIVEAAGLKTSDFFVGPRQRRPKDDLEPPMRAAVSRAEEDFRHHPAAARSNHPLTVLISDDAHLDQSIARALALAVEGELVQVALEGMHGN
jgi:hypothetical protein